MRDILNAFTSIGASTTYRTKGGIKPVLGKQNWVGKLTLDYYESGEPFHRVIPFYENCKIQESQSPRLATYSPIGRATNSFAYTGSDSRKFKLKFSITLPHLYNLDTPVQTIQNTRGYTKEQKKQIFLKFGKFIKESFTSNADKNKKTMEMEHGGGGPALKYDVHYQNTLDEMDQKLYNWAKRGSPMYDIDSNGNAQRRKIIDKLVSMVASVRSCVVNNTTNPVYGIPIVRLSYGILYDNVPCVCESYTIDYDENAGFDLKTLLPRRLMIGMNLKETRTLEGSASRVEDKLKGWEVILADEFGGTTMDPGGGF